MFELPERRPALVDDEWWARESLLEWWARESLLGCIRSHEGSYTTNTGNGYFGAYQFDLPTWAGAVTGAGHPEWASRLPSDAPGWVQDDAAWTLYLERGLHPWPTPEALC